MRDRIIESFQAPGQGPGISSGSDTGGTAWGDLAARAPGPPMAYTLAAVLVPLIDHASGMTVLLTRRTEHLTSHAGQISFPGGRMEAADPTPEDTALRETEEEVGLMRDAIRLVGRLGVRETGTGYKVVPVVGLIDPPLALIPDPSEVAEVFEVPLDFVLDPANHRIESTVVRGVEREFYVMPYNGHRIWGLTARLLVTLAEVIKR